MKRTMRVMFLVALILAVMAGNCFAGTWQTASLRGTSGSVGAGTVGGKTYLTQSTMFTATTQPYIDFWVHPSTGTKTVYVELFEKKNNVWVLVEQTTHTVQPNGYNHFIDYSNIGSSSNPRVYQIEIDGNYSVIDGFVKYFY